MGSIPENVAFLELKRRGYRVTIGKLGNREIDFIAQIEARKICVQVACLLHSPETIARPEGDILYCSCQDYRSENACLGYCNGRMMPHFCLDSHLLIV